MVNIINIPIYWEGSPAYPKNTVDNDIEYEHSTPPQRGVTTSRVMWLLKTKIGCRICKERGNDHCDYDERESKWALQRLVWLLGLIIFIIGGIMCGFAPHPPICTGAKLMLAGSPLFLGGLGVGFWRWEEKWDSNSLY